MDERQDQEAESAGRQDQAVQRAGRELEQQTDGLQERTDQLGDEIDSVRQEFQRKRNDDNVPGLPPEPEAEQEPGESGTSERESPAPEAPPGRAGPEGAQQRPEGAAGPPADDH